ncbi:MAG: MMPL family transporter [Candidatus Binatia bacterium]
MGRLLARWVAWIARHALPVLLVVIVSTVGIGVYTANNLGVNADLDDMFAPDVPFRAREAEYERAFPLVGRDVVIVVDAGTPEQARDAARALATRMRAEPALFKSVFEPEGPFFEDHAFLYMDTDELEEFADRLARVQPYLAGLAEDGTLRGLADLLARGAAAVREGDVAPGELAPMLARVDMGIEAVLAGEPYRLSWAEIVAGGELGAGSRRRLVIMQPVLDFTDLLAGADSIEAVRGYARELGFDREGSAVRVRMTGDIALSIEEMTLVQEQAGTAGVVSMILVGILLLVSLRSVRLALATLFTLALGLIWTAGFAALAVGHLNLLSVAFAVLFIGLSVDFALHLCMRYQELLADRWPAAEALAETARDVGTSITLCAMTTAIGFFAFVPTDFSGVAELGLISGAGMFISLFLNLTVLPALISLHRSRRGRRGLAALAVASPRLIPAFSIRHPRRVASVALVLGAVGVVLLPRLSFDADPIRVRDPRAESVRAFEDLIAASEHQPWEIAVIADDLERGERLARKLRDLEVVEEAFTVRDFVPEDQAEKLAIIEDVALFLAPPPDPSGLVPPPTLGEEAQALRRLQHELIALSRTTRDRDVVTASRALAASLDRFLERAGAAGGTATNGVDVAMLDALEISLLDSLPNQLDSLQRAINVGPITLDELPATLVGRMVSAEGRVRVRVLPREELSNPETLERFVTSVREVAPEATGSAVSIYEASRAAVRSFQQALGAAVAVIVVLLLLIWRTIGAALLVLAPLALAGVLTGAVAVVVGIPINFADIIVLPLLLGIGVDSGIHLVERARLSQAAAGRLLETSTAHAVLFSALTTIASFGTLGFAGHRGMASMGQLLAVGVALAVLANLLVLPALIQLDRMRD